MNHLLKGMLPAALLAGLWLCVPGCRDAPPPGDDGKKPEVVSFSTPPEPAVGGVRVEPPGGDLAAVRFLQITFPVDMVAKEEVGNKVTPPVVMEPSARSFFHWTGTRSGILETRLSGYVDVMRRLRLAPDLRDAAGNPVDAAGWGADFADAEMAVVGVGFLSGSEELVDPDPDFRLGGMSQVLLTFNRDVLPAAIAGNIAFIDAETRQRHPVRVALEQEQPDEPQATVVIEPANPLPMERTYWLVVERTSDYTGNYPLPHLRVFPAGKTQAIKLTWSRAYNQPRTGAFIRLGFNHDIDMAALDPATLRIDPPVKISKMDQEKSALLVFGDFKTGANYRVTVPAGVASRDGSVTLEDRTVEVTLPERRPAIVLESARVSAPVAAFALDVELYRMRDVTWRIAAIPPEHHRAVGVRLTEFASYAENDEGDAILDPRDGNVRYTDTDFLIPALGLPVIASGNLDGTPDAEPAARKIDWPADQVRPGSFLVEFQGTAADGRTIGNRCLVTLSDWMVRHYDGSDGGSLHLARAVDGTPLAGARVTVYPYPEDKRPQVREAGPNGFVSLTGVYGSSFTIEHGGYSIFREKTPETTASSGSSDDAWKAGEVRGLLFTDGDVFQPGETVRFSATLRARDAVGELVIPENRERKLLVTGSDDQVTHAIDLMLDEAGMATGEFILPADAPGGTYKLALDDADTWQPEGGMAGIVVTDFRMPEVNVTLSAPDMTGETGSIRVAASYFHGAPLAGAKVAWRAEWLGYDWITADNGWSEKRNPWLWWEFGDRVSPAASNQGIEGVFGALRAKATADYSYDGAAIAPPTTVLRGEGTLDPAGNLTIATDCPFQPSVRGHRARIRWIVDVLGHAGENHRAVAQQGIQYAERTLALQVSNDWNGGVLVEPVAITLAHTKGEGFPVAIEVMRREVRFAKEAVGEGIVRYRNTPVFESVFKGEMRANEKLNVPTPIPGDYIVVAEPRDMPGAPRVSAQVFGVGGVSDGPVLDDFSAEAIPTKAEWTVGENAEILVRSPLAGWAQVTVETDRLLDVLPPVRINGSADHITVPVKAGYFPNCFVRIHIQNAGADGSRPVERMAVCELKVRDPRIELRVDPVLQSPVVRPRETVAASVRVTSLDRPVAGARVVVGVIDEALLSLGSWRTPDPVATFYPPRDHSVGSARAVDATWYRFETATLRHSQKGFILGDGGGFGGGGGMVRKNERPRPFWQSDGVTDANGELHISFEAPDTLTRYRVFAHAVSGPKAVGAGEAPLTVTQPIRIKPLLPRFLREGDRLDLRCRIDVDPMPGGPVELLFTAAAEGDSLQILSAASQTLRIDPGTSQIVPVSARVAEMMAGNPASLTFTARNAAGAGDAIRVTLPVHSAFIERIEHRGGFLAPDASLAASEVFDGLPSSGGVPCDFFLSGTRWMPKLVAMRSPGTATPTLADEAGAALGALLAVTMDGYLPPRFSQREAVDRRFREAMAGIEKSIIPDAGFGWLPRWPGGTEPDGATTALVAIIVDLAAREQTDASENPQVPDRLTDALQLWCRAMLAPSPTIFSGTPPTHFERCVALALESTEAAWVDHLRLRVVIRDLYGHREELDLESKCFLALAEARLRNRTSSAVTALEPDERANLISEIERQDAPLAFNPATLGSRMRAEAIRLHTLSTLRQGMGSAALREIERLLQPVLAGSLDLNAQENLWILLAMRGALAFENPAPLAGRVEAAIEPDVSPNEVTLAWMGHPVSTARSLFTQPMRPGVVSEWMLRVAHREPVSTPKGGADLTLTRKLVNLTDPARDGSAAAPFAIGDSILLHYVVTAATDTHHLQIDEHLPAGLDVVNPDLPSVRRNFALPQMETVDLSHVERSPDRIRLYFELLEPGSSQYAILAQVTTPGEFRWPAASAIPMYDKRLQASTVDSVFHSQAAK